MQTCEEKPMLPAGRTLSSTGKVACFYHTGNTAMFTTSLMHPLYLSKAAIKDGFPMLLPAIFLQPRILSAMRDGFSVNAAIDHRRACKQPWH